MDEHHKISYNQLIRKKKEQKIRRLKKQFKNKTSQGQPSLKEIERAEFGYAVRQSVQTLYLGF